MKKTILILIKKKLTISTAESCTGGMLSSKITSISGASKIFSLGFVTYSNQAKMNILKVPRSIIQKHGSVSSQCCVSMLKNLSKISRSKLCVSITGIAGPKGGSKNKPIGLVYIGIKKGKKILVSKNFFKNNGRLSIQKATVKKSLDLVFNLVK
mgnify:FL=1